jgi:hypothetical protein
MLQPRGCGKILHFFSGTWTSLRRTGRQAVGQSSQNNLAAPGVRRLLNRVKQLVAFDGHIEVWVDGLSFANALSPPRIP